MLFIQYCVWQGNGNLSREHLLKPWTPKLSSSLKVTFHGRNKPGTPSTPFRMLCRPTCPPHSPPCVGAVVHPALPVSASFFGHHPLVYIGQHRNNERAQARASRLATTHKGVGGHWLGWPVGGTLSTPHRTPPRPRPPSSRHRPPRSPSPGQRGPHGPRRTHPPPCPHPRTSARRHAWRT